MTNVDYVGLINTELISAIIDAPVMAPKDPYVESALERLFGAHDWTKSFETRQVLLYDELVPSEVLKGIHYWLRRKSANIENVCLVTTHHKGISTWWGKWCDVNYQKSFQIKELLFTDSPRYRKKWFDNISPLPLMDTYRSSKEISKLFSFYGGSHSNWEREYLLLKMLEFSNVAEIDFIGKFSSKQELLNYAENLTYYSNQREIDSLSLMYDRYVLPTQQLSVRPSYVGQSVKDERITFSGLQWEVDRHSWASVVRETSNSDVYCSVTEKTLRAFIHHTAVIPVGFKAVAELENLGFWFPHDIVDYSYQENQFFAQRINNLVYSLNQVLEKHSFAQLQEYYLDNLKNFHHNAKLVYDYINNKESYL